MTYLLANLLLSTYHHLLSSWSPLYAPNSLLSGLSWSLGVLLASMLLVRLSVLLYARVRWMEDPGNGVDNLAELTQVLVVVFGEKHGFTSVALAGGTNGLHPSYIESFKAEGAGRGGAGSREQRGEQERGDRWSAEHEARAAGVGVGGGCRCGRSDGGRAGARRRAAPSSTVWHRVVSSSIGRVDFCYSDAPRY
ncbi:hypothetical protein B0H14DRAFT_3130143 [Mycena olivaceomarginata]|nr:hypothetical protein B0H14DRAFT_3130143 [Mycena olivaceomarginata]